MEQKKLVKVQILKTAKTATVVNCREEDGEFYYYLRVPGERGLTLLHESQLRIL